MQSLKLTTFVNHAIGWLLLLSLPLLFLTQQPGSQQVADLLVYPDYWVFNLSMAFLFYIHAYWLFPALYVRKKYVAYVASLGLLLVGVVFLRPFDRLVSNNLQHDRIGMPVQGPIPNFGDRLKRPFPPPRPPMERRSQHFDVVSVFLFFMLVGFGVALQTVQRLRETEKRALRAETDKANAELSFLKAQINPHFLFNTLNNIYSLAITESEHTADSIMKLSNIMRYVTDEVTADLVPLESEVACIQDYIDLQRLRLSKQVELTYMVSGDLSGKSIPPMVLMTFVENVFKYGISNHEAATIMIKLTAEVNSITFFTRNKLFEVPRNVVRTGVGLANIRQRLAHLYPDRHSLNIQTDDGFFTVQLNLQT